MNDTYKTALIGLGPAGVGFLKGLSDEGLLEDCACFELGEVSQNDACTQIVNGFCCNSETCHVISGGGGSSNLSSGKISNYPAGSGLLDFFDSENQLKERLTYILNELEKHIGLSYVNVDDSLKNQMCEICKSNNIIYKYYDVYNFNGALYQNYISNIIKQCCDKGLTLFSETKVVDIQYDADASVYTIISRKRNIESRVYAKNVVLATGNLISQSDLFEKLGIRHELVYEIGVRIESSANNFNDYIKSHGDLKLKLNNARTYCITENGFVISYKIDNMHFLEGSTNDDQKTGYTNLAVLLKAYDIDSLIKFKKNYENIFGGVPIMQKFADYVHDRENEDAILSSHYGAKCGNINRLFSQEVNNDLKFIISKFVIEILGVSTNDVNVIAPELKLVNKFDLSQNFQTSQPGLYTIGAVTGKFRGILQCLCSGLKCSENFTRR